VAVSPGNADTIRVPQDRHNLNAALSSAHDGDVVLVADGVYTGPMNRTLDFRGKAVTLRSEHGPESCVIDCQGAGRAFRFHRGEGRGSVIEGITIRNGVAADGGGVLCENASSPTLSNCVLAANTGTGTAQAGGGGGLLCRDGSSPSVRDCRFIANTT